MVGSCAGSNGWLYGCAKQLINFSPLAFADERLEGGFLAAERAYGLQLARACFAAQSMLAVLDILSACPVSSEERILSLFYIGTCLLASHVLKKFSNISSENLQVGKSRVSPLPNE